MLSNSRVLNYIKSNLGFPFVNIELTDAQIMSHVVDFTLREFSQYVPYVRRIPMNLTLTSLQVPDKQNEYYIPATNYEILNVAEVYFSDSDLYIHGHPVIGPMAHNQIGEWALQVTQAMDTKMFSSFDRTWEFTHPNIIRISPIDFAISSITVDCEVIQPSDFSQIPNEFQILFSEFALASIMIIIGNIRKKYGGQIRSPYGEIPLDVEILSEGKDKKRELIEKLNTCHPNVTIDIG